MSTSGFGGISFHKLHRLPSLLITDKDRASINLCVYFIYFYIICKKNTFFSSFTFFIRLIGEKSQKHFSLASIQIDVYNQKESRFILMSKNENKKFPVAAIILSGIVIVLAVLAISFCATARTPGNLASVGVLELVAGVLFLAALTTGRNVFSRVVSILTLVANIIVSFVLVVVKVYTQNVALLAISLLMLVAAVLSLIYYLTSFRNKRIAKMFYATGFILAVLVFMYASFYIASDLSAIETDPASELEPLFENYFLLFGLGTLATIPPTLRLTVKDDEEEVQPEEKAAE